MASATQEDYQLTKVIGFGSFGSVYMAKRVKDEAILAVKIIQLEEGEEFSNILQEIEIMKSCMHPNIVAYFESFLRPDSLCLYLWICMEYCDGGSLCSIYSVTGALSEDQIAFACKETLKGLDYLHSRRMMHRDIKGANILVTAEGDVKLADFGLSAQITATMSKRKTTVGTYHWMAPEVIDSEKKGGHNELCDIWSLGITAIELAECQPPLSQFRPVEAAIRISKPGYKPPTLTDKDKWSTRFHNFVKAALTKNPQTRPNAQVLLQKFFFKGNHLTNKLMRELLDNKNQIMLQRSSAPQLLNNLPSFRPQNIPSPNSNPVVVSQNPVPQNFPPPNSMVISMDPLQQLQSQIQNFPPPNCNSYF